MHKFLDPPEGFRIEKITDVDADETRYVFGFDRSYAYRVSEPIDSSISEEWLDKKVVHSGMERLIEDLERCIAKYKAENPDE